MKFHLSLFALTFLSASSLHAQEASLDHPADWHCMTDHFREALALNIDRKPLYSMISQGESEAVSDALMDFERSLTKGTRPLLPLVKTYWRKGVPLLCKEFIPIAETPGYSDTFATPVPEGKVKFVNPLTLIARLQFAYLSGGNAKLREAGRKEIAALDKADHFQCMTKHFLESIVYTAEMSDAVSEISETKGMGSTHWVTRITNTSQILSLTTTSKLDRMAENLHRQGLPILCNDVPLILKDLAPNP